MKFLDKEEKEIIESFEKGNWISVSDSEKEEYIKMAKKATTKNKRINIRLTEQDYNNIKVQAMKEGLPYQTLISSIIHKYTIGKLKPVVD